MGGAQLACLILCHLLESFCYSVKGPFGGFHFISENGFCTLPSLLLSTQGMPVSSFWEYNQYHCSTSLAPSTLWLAIHAATGIVFLLAFLSRHPLEASLLLIFRGSNIPTSLVCTTLFPTFSITFHDAPFSPQTRTTPTLSMVYLLLPPETCCNIAGISWSCVIPHPPLSPPTQTARN